MTAALKEIEIAEIASASPDTLLVAADPSGRILYANPACEAMTGRPAADLKGRPVGELFSGGLDQVLGTISHDLRSPLGSVRLMADLLLANAASWTESDRARVRIIAAAAQQMERLIDDLLDAATLRDGRLTIMPGRHSSRALVEQAVVLHRDKAETLNLTCIAELPRALPDVVADGSRISQAFANLIDNAMKFTPAGGTVRLSASSFAEHVGFSVSDTGRGIPAEQQPFVFDRFWKGNPSSRGTGLGLSIVRDIIEAHGGTIWVDSAAGAGATFHFTLPRATRSSCAGT